MYINTGPPPGSVVLLSLYVLVSKDLLSPDTSEKAMTSPLISTL